MSRFRQLVREIHRRSVWQVLGVYLVGSWGALQVVDVLVQHYGLPDWVPPFALVLLIVGLPVVLATAIVQEGTPTRDGADAGARRERSEAALLEGEPHPFRLPEEAPDAEARGGSEAGGRSGSDSEPLHHRLFTWRNAILGGVGAFVLLGVAVGAYFFMWSAGIGPVGSLVAQGVLEEREQVVLADFANATSEPTLGDAVTEALRMDLVESPVLRVADPGFVQQTLTRMQRDPEQPLTTEVARELAVREGLKAVIHGEVTSAGSGYVLTASIISAEDARTLAGFRVTARDGDDVIPAIDELSQRLREKAGESLRSIKGGEPLSRVTTSSLEALSRYSQAVRAFDTGDNDRALSLLEEAVARDSTFAMAWRKIGVIHYNRDDDPARMREALTRAYELRDRLTARERYLTVGMYHEGVTRDQEAAVRAYRNVLDTHPDDGTALNNLGFRYVEMDRPREAEEVLRRAIGGPGEGSNAYQNLVWALHRQGKLDEAVSVGRRFEVRYPEHPLRFALVGGNLFWSEDYERADSVMVHALQELDGRDRIDALAVSAAVDAVRGRLREARSHLEEVGDRAVSRSRSGSEIRNLVGRARLERWGARDSAAALRILDEAAGRLSEVGDSVGADHRLRLAEDYALLGAAGRAERLLRGYRDEVPEAEREPDWEREVAIGEALVLGARGRHDESIAELQRIRRRDPECDDRCGLRQLARLHDLAARTDSAAAYYERAIEEERRRFGFPLPYGFFYPYALERLAELHEAAGRDEEARRYYREFAELWADADPELQRRVQRAREKLEVLAAAGS